MILGHFSLILAIFADKLSKKPWCAGIDFLTLAPISS